MGFIDHIHACNNHDLSKFVPFRAPEGTQLGWIAKSNLAVLQPYVDVFSVAQDNVRLMPQADLSAAMKAVTLDMREKGYFEHWRDEPYKVAPRFLDRPLFVVERAATPFFGIRAFGVHINGYVRTEGGLKMWIGKRAQDRAICPGMFDNMVAGGQPADLGLMENLIKECGEEANIPESLARTAQSVGTISYRMETDGGLKPDVMFCYDLELPEDFTPVNTDGETEEFTLWPIEEVAAHIKEGGNFKFNCNLVIIDFLIRHGLINPDTEPDYEDLVRGLRR